MIEMPLVRYSAARIGLLVVLVGFGWAVGLRSWLLVVVAVAVAYSLSVIAMRPLRDATTVWLQERSAHRAGRPRVDADAADEDAAVEGLIAGKPAAQG